MPSPIRENYERILASLDASGLNGVEYNRMKTGLSQLMNNTDPFFERDRDGLYKNVEERDRDLITKCYMQTAVSCQHLVELYPDNAQLQELAGNLSKEINVLNLMETGPHATLPRALDYANTQVVDITGASLQRAGAALSSRMPMTITSETGAEVKGFFTPESTFDPTRDWLNKLNEQIKGKKPEEIAPLDQFWDKFTDYVNNLPERKGKEPLKPGDGEVFNAFGELFFSDRLKNEHWPFGRLYRIMKDVVGMDVPPIDNLYNLPQSKNRVTPFEAALYNSSGSITKYINSYKINAGKLGIHVGDNIDKRNSAMTSVAGLLKVPGLIVKAVPMKVVNNGVETTGTFLPNAEGLDINRPDLSNKNISDNKEKYRNTNGFKDLADLQVLDYICGNIDRHTGNLLYKFDENGKFAGVQGIDNDASFGLFEPDIFDSVQALPAVCDFHFMSKSMAETVQNLKPEQLKITLADRGLHSAEIDAACNRLAKLQTEITAGIEYYREHGDEPIDKFSSYIRVIDDEEFKNIDFVSDKMFHDLRLGSVSYLAYGESLRQDITTLTDPNKQKQQAKVFEQPEVRELSVSDARAMTARSTEYSNKLNELLNVDCWYIPSSTQFKKMRVSLERLNNLAKEYKNRPLDASGYEKFQTELTSIERNAAAYVTMKSAEQGRSDYANSRLAFATGLQQFIAERRTELVTRVKNEVSVREDRKLDAKGILNQFKRELQENNNKLTPELAGKAVKAANAASKLIPVRDKLAQTCGKLIEAAVTYLRKTPEGMKQSKLSGQDIKDAMKTIQKSAESADYSAKKTQELKNKVSETLHQGFIPKM